jgi:hypothetical protein
VDRHGNSTRHQQLKVIPLTAVAPEIDQLNDLKKVRLHPTNICHFVMTGSTVLCRVFTLILKRGNR